MTGRRGFVVVEAEKKGQNWIVGAMGIFIIKCGTVRKISEEI